MGEVQPALFRRGEQPGLLAEVLRHVTPSALQIRHPHHVQQFPTRKSVVSCLGALLSCTLQARVSSTLRSPSRVSPRFSAKDPSGSRRRVQRHSSRSTDAPVQLGTGFGQPPPTPGVQPQPRQEREEQRILVETGLDPPVFQLLPHGGYEAVRLCFAFFFAQHGWKQRMRQIVQPVHRQRTQFRHAKPVERPLAAAIGVGPAGHHDPQIGIVRCQRLLRAPESACGAARCQPAGPRPARQAAGSRGPRHRACAARRRGQPAARRQTRAHSARSPPLPAGAARRRPRRAAVGKPYAPAG